MMLVERKVSIPLQPGFSNNNPPAKPGVFRIAAPSKGAHRNPTSKAHSEQAWAVVKRDCQGQIQILNYSKEEVKRFIWERARVRFGDIPTGNLVSFSQKNLKLYADVDPGYGMPIADKADDIVIVVMGGAGTHSLSVQTRLACENITVPITKKDGTHLTFQ
jgi:hypothetical protein